MAKTARLAINHTIFVDEQYTADYQMTRGLREILDRDGNAEDLIAFMTHRNLPIDEIEANKIAAELLNNKPRLDYLTISNALQWRLQYTRVLLHAGSVPGVIRIS